MKKINQLMNMFIQIEIQLHRIKFLSILNFYNFCFHSFVPDDEQVALPGIHYRMHEGHPIYLLSYYFLIDLNNLILLSNTSPEVVGRAHWAQLFVCQNTRESKKIMAPKLVKVAKESVAHGLNCGSH